MVACYWHFSFLPHPFSTEAKRSALFRSSQIQRKVRNGHLDKNRTKKNMSWLHCSGAVPLLLAVARPSPQVVAVSCLSEQPRKEQLRASRARPAPPSFSPHQPFGTCTAHNAAHPVLFGCLATITKSPACFLYGSGTSTKGFINYSKRDGRRSETNIIVAAKEKILGGCRWLLLSSTYVCTSLVVLLVCCWTAGAVCGAGGWFVFVSPANHRPVPSRRPTNAEVRLPAPLY